MKTKKRQEFDMKLYFINLFQKEGQCSLDDISMIMDIPPSVIKTYCVIGEDYAKRQKRNMGV